MRLVSLLLLLAAFAIAEEGPTCALSCYSEGGSGGIQYEAGKQYKYEYKAQVTSKALVTEPDESQLVMLAQIIVSANTPCDLKLQVEMEDVEAADDQVDKAKWFRDALQEHDLHFSYDDGRIKFLCPNEAEDPVATNFKRGVLSALQVSITDLSPGTHVLEEEDVSGWCETKYSVESEGEVTKTKSGCHASGHLPYIPHTHYHTRPSHQAPGFRSHQSCDLKHTDGQVNEVGCTEEITVSTSLASWVGNNTASTTDSALAYVTVSSMLKQLNVGDMPEGDFSKDGVLWDQAPLSADLEGAAMSASKRRPGEENVKEQIESTLESLVASLDQDSGLVEQRPHLFSRLADLLGALKGPEEQEEQEEGESEIEAVWEANRKKQDHRNFLLDALLLCESSQCVGLMAGISADQELGVGGLDSGLSRDRIRAWLTALHFHHHPQAESLKAVLELGSSVPELDGITKMAASTMVHKICHHNSTICANVSQPFLARIQENLNTWCPDSEEPQPPGSPTTATEDIVQTLRALGNAGVSPDKAMPELCYRNRNLAPSVRVAALQSYRRVGCSGNGAPWKILKDGSEPGEVRIAAYLALVPCATQNSDFFTRIKDIMDREEDTQVGTYIWSHVKSLSDNPGPGDYERELSDLARQYSMPSRFSTTTQDFRSSRNQRFSRFSQLLNLGGSMDTNMIFSPASFFPHQLSMNLSLDLLDTSFNALEVGGEFSGLENLLQTFFGKEGYFGNEHILNLVRPEGKWPGSSHTEGQVRSAQNIIRDDKIQEFQKLYDEEKSGRDELEGDVQESKGSVYLRVFGNEVVYIKDIFQLAQPEVLLSYLRELVTASRSFKMMDQKYVRATHIGFPLQLKLNATGSVVFDHDYKMEMTENGGTSIEGTVAPSLVISTDETLFVDGYISASGLRRSSTHSARTQLGGKLTLDNGEVAEAQISVPGSEVTKIGSSVKVAMYDNAKKGWREQDDPQPDDTTEYCTPERVSHALGLKVCGSVGHGTYEMAGETVAGEPYKTDVTVTKTDSFNYYRLYVKNSDNVIEALFDTPGSNTDRKIHFLFNMRPNNAGGYVVIRGMGYGVEGQYENSEDLKKLAFEYRQASKVLGKLEVSVEKKMEGVETHFIPVLKVTLGKDNFNFDGKLSYSNQENNEEGLQVSLEGDGTWQKVEGGRQTTQALGLVTGYLVSNRKKTRVHATADYGVDRTDTDTVSLTLDLAGGKGYAALQASQIDTTVGLDLVFHTGHAQLTTNVTVQDTQVASEIILKNLAEGNSRDFHVKASLESDQLSLNYIGEVLYKVADDALQAEVEVKLDTRLHSRLMLTYLWRDLHHLAGLHVTLNDFVAEFGHHLDFSNDNQAHFMVSCTALGYGGGVELSADYDRGRPLNASLSMYGQQGEDRVVGAALSLLSDPQWVNIDGRSNLKWFDWTFAANQTLVLEDGKTELMLKLEDDRTIKISSETSPDRSLEFSIGGGSEEEPPEFHFGVESRNSGSGRLFNLNLTTGADVLFHFGFLLDSERTLTSSLQLLQSRLAVEGEYEATGGFYSAASTFSGSATATVTLPSGRNLTSSLTLAHTYDGERRTLSATSSQNGETVEGFLTFVSREGWFDDDLTSLNLTIATPLDQMAKLGLLFHKSGEPSALNYAEVFLDDVKVRGESQLGDSQNLTLGVSYQASDQCTTRLFLRHQEHDNNRYTTHAGIVLTDQHAWEVAVNTTLEDLYNMNGLSMIVKFQAPVLTGPVDLYASHNLTQNHFGIELRAGIGEDVFSAHVSGQKEWSWQRHMLQALGEFKTSWTDPLSLNATYDHTHESFGINLDFQSSIEYVSSWVAEIGSNYENPHDTKAFFYLTYDDLQVAADFVQNKSRSGLTQQLDASINTFSVTYNVDLQMDQYSLSKIKGRASLFNLFDHNLYLTLVHKKEMDTFITEASGSFNDYNFELKHKLDYSGYWKWSDSLDLTLMGDVGVTKAKLSFENHIELPFINSTLEFTSDWTDDYSEKFTTQLINRTVIIKYDSFYGDDTLVSSTLTSTGPINEHHSNLELQASSSFFEDLEVKWQHDFDVSSLVLGEVTYGNEFYAHLGSELKLEEDWIGNYFSSYDLTILTNITSLDLHCKASVSANLQQNGEVELRWNDYYFRATSTLFLDGKIEVVMNNGVTEYQAVFKFEVDTGLPVIHFIVSQDGQDIVTLDAVTESRYPRLEVLSTLLLHGEKNSTLEKGQLRIIADLSKLNENSFKGSANLESNLGGVEGLEGDLDVELMYRSPLVWAGDVDGTLKIMDQSYNAQLNSSLKVNNEVVKVEFGTRYESAQANLIQNLKDISFLVTLTNEFELLVRIATDLDPWLPPLSLGVHYKYRYGDFKGFVRVGDGGYKYELSSRISSRTFTIDAQRIDSYGNKFQILQGNINWITRRVKQLVTLNMKSDYKVITKMSGTLIIQKTKNLAVKAKLTVNDETFNGNFKLHPTQKGYRIEIKLNNEIQSPFKTDITLDLSLMRQGIQFDSRIDLNNIKEWFAGNIKVSLPESYLKLKMPIPQFQRFNITLTTETENAYGGSLIIQAPQFCFNITGKLDKMFGNGDFNTNLKKTCSDDQFNFNSMYKIDSNPISIYSYLDIPAAYIEPFKLNITGTLEADEFDLRAESDVPGYLSHGLYLAAQWKEQHSFTLKYYSPLSNETMFNFKTSFSSTMAELAVELPKNDQTLTLNADYNFIKQPFKVNGSLFNSLFGYELDANFIVDASIKNDLGKVEMALATDTAFSHINMSLSYDLKQEELKEASFKLQSPKGNAEGKVQILKLDDKFFSIIAEMTSDLHSFEVYAFEFVFEEEGPLQKFRVQTVLDLNESSHLNGVKQVFDDRVEINVTLTTTIPGYEQFDLKLIHPSSSTSGEINKGKLSAMLSGEEYILEGMHNSTADLYEFKISRKTTMKHIYGVRIVYHSHDFDFEKHSIDVFFSAPHFDPEAVSVKIGYDLQSKTAGFIFDSPRGMVGINGTWSYTPGIDLDVSVNYYLSYFDLGMYKSEVSVPFKIPFEDIKLKLSCHHPDLNFVSHVIVGDDLKRGIFSLVMNSTTDLNNRTYNFSYINQQSLTLEAQFDKWHGMTKWTLTGVPIAVLSGFFEWKSNLPGYEAIEGSWSITETNRIHYIQLKVDIQRWGTLVLSTSLNLQQSSYDEPWRRAKLSAQFESPFTLTHHLHVEYDLDALTMVLYYQRGPDIFQVQWNARFDRRASSFFLRGNVPIKGLSTFSINFSFNFDHAYLAKFDANIEDSSFGTSFEISPEWMIGSVKFSLKSPFTRSAKTELDWSFSQSPYNLEAIVSAGDYTVKLRTSVDIMSDSVDIEFQASITMEETSSLSFKLAYKLTDNKYFDGTLIAKANDHFMKMESAIHSTMDKVLVKFDGIIKVIDIGASVEIDFDMTGDTYNAKISGELPNYERFHISFLKDSYQLKVLAKYQAREVFSMNVLHSHAKIQLKLTDFWSFTLEMEGKSEARRYHFLFSFNGFNWDTTALKLTFFRGRRQQLDLSLDSPFLPSTQLHITYAAGNDHKFTARLTLDETVYELTGRLEMRRRQSILNLLLESSDDTQNPVKLSAKYNIRDFLVGKMQTAKELGSVVFEWGQKLEINMTGLRNGDRIKLDATVSTPFNELPRLLLGYDGTFSQKNSLDIAFNSYVNGTHTNVLSVHTKLSESRVELQWTLDSTYLEVSKIASSLLLTPGHAEVTLQYSENNWKAEIDYRLSPFFLLKCKVETPIIGFKELSASAFMKLENDKFLGKFDFGWPEDQQVKLNLALEMWKADIKLETPWTPFTMCTLKASLTTDSERLLFSSDLRWDERNIETALSLDPNEIKFQSEYQVDRERVSRVKLEAVMRNEVKGSLELITPIESLTSLVADLEVKNQEFEARLVINDVPNMVKGGYNYRGGELEVNLPYFGDFKFSLEAENRWKKLDSEIIFFLPQQSTPITIVLKYDVDTENLLLESLLEVSNERKLFSAYVEFNQEATISLVILDNNMEITLAWGEETKLTFNLETEFFKLEKLSIVINVKNEQALSRRSITLRVRSKLRYKNTQRHLLHLTASTQGRLLLLKADIEGDSLLFPYSVKISLPGNLFSDRKADIKLEIDEGDKEWLVLTHIMDIENVNWLVRHFVTVKFQDITTNIRITLKTDSFSIDWGSPGTEMVHAFKIFWPEDFNFEKFTFGAELTSPYMDESPVKFKLDFSQDNEYQASVRISYVQGRKHFIAIGDFHYDIWQKKLQVSAKADSDWTGSYSIKAEAEWRRSVIFSAVLTSSEEEHKILAVLDLLDYNMRMSLRSPSLPMGEITFTGDINSDFNINNFRLDTSLTAGERDLHLEAEFENNPANMYVVLRLDGNTVFSASAVLTRDQSSLGLEIDQTSTFLPELNSHFEFQYKHQEQGRIISAYLSQMFLLGDDDITLQIDSGGNSWRDLQVLTFRTKEYAISVDLDIKIHFVNLKVRSPCNELYLTIGHLNEDTFSISIQTTIPMLEVIYLRVKWRVDGDKSVMIKYVHDGKNYEFDVDLLQDVMFGKTLEITLLTPMENLDKVVLKTPRYIPGKHVDVGAIIEMPGCKVGGEISLNYTNIFNSYFVIGLYLPFEEYEMLSLRYIFLSGYEYAIEARVGKIGFTLSLEERSKYNGLNLEAIARLNEYQVKMVLSEASAFRKVIRYTLDIETKPEFLPGFQTLRSYIKYTKCNGFEIGMLLNFGELMKLAVGWGDDKSLELLTPMILPGHVHIIYLSNDNKDNYMIAIALDDPIDIDNSILYRIDLGQVVTGSGRNIFFVIDGFDNHFAALGELFLDYRIIHSLFVELNENRIGYRTNAGIDPGLLSHDYTADLEMYVNNRTMHYNGHTTHSFRELEMSNRFTWNKLDNLMPPIYFNISYADHSIFGYQRHYLEARFAHPDIKDIVLQGNLTQPDLSVLHGVAEFIDGNSPDMRVIMLMNTSMVSEKEEKVIVNITQPSSGFAVIMDQRMKQIDNMMDDSKAEIKSLGIELDHNIKYWRLDKEEWKELNFSSGFNEIPNGFDFRTSVNISDSNWGYKWKGYFLNKVPAVAFGIKGTSMELEDFWEIGTEYNKFIPEVQISLLTGRGDNDVHEAGRARFGLHSPVAAGVILEHQQFGRWTRDASAGLQLSSPCVLQFFTTLNPSLQLDRQSSWARLSSPAPHIWSSWVRDGSFVITGMQEWAVEEGPALLENLLKKETLETVWEREVGNWGYLLQDLDDTIIGFKKAGEKLWSSYLLPAIQEVQTFITTGYQTLLTYYETLKSQMTEQLNQAWEQVMAAWTYLSEMYLMPWTQWMGEATGGVAGNALGAVQSFFTNRFKQMATTSAALVQTQWTSLVEGVQSWAEQLGTAIQKYVDSVWATIQPNFEIIREGIISYVAEAFNAVKDNCWQHLVDKLTALTNVQEGVGEALAVLTEFLQPEEYVSHFTAVKDVVVEWGQQLLTIMEEVYSAVQQKAVELWESMILPLGEALKTAYQGMLDTFTRIYTEGFETVANEMATAVQEALTGMYDQVVAKIKELSDSLLTYISQQPIYDQAKEALGDVYEWVMATYDKWASGERQDLTLVERILFPAADILRKIVNEGKLLDRLYQFKPQTHGVILYNQYLPTPCWPSFYQDPHFTNITNVLHEPPVAEAERLLDSEAEGSSGLWRLHGLPYTLLPPLFATATVAGQHITTFDGRHHQFLGSCSYLLAKDFVGGDFEVVGVYQSGTEEEEVRGGEAGLESVVVHGPRTDVTLHVSGAITSNPVIPPGAKVYLTNEAVVLVTPDLVVACHNLTHTCIVSVSPKYFNRLGGLLGNLNHDPADDSLGPGGQPETTDPAVLARLWAISPSPCYQANQANTVTEPSEAPAEDVLMCQDVFLRSSSPFSPCFSLVDPRPYYRDCLAGRRHPARSNRQLRPPCPAAEAYLAQCRARGLKLSQVEQCGKDLSTEGCMVDGNRVKPGWSKVFRRGEFDLGMADVVLMVETATCNQNRNIKKLISYIDAQLNRRNIIPDNVRYALVTVPGDGEGEAVMGEFTSSGLVVAALDELTFVGSPASHVKNTEAIISAASELPFRPHASRSIVHIACEGCGVGETGGEEGELLAALMGSDITYHTMTTFNITMAGSVKEAAARKRKLFGFDKDLAYITRDYVAFRGNEKVRWALSQPDGVCVGVALASGGSVFTVDKWIPAKRTLSKKLISVFGERVAVSGMPSECQECHCRATGGVPQCSRCFTSPMFYLPLSYGTRGMDKELESDSIEAEIKKSFREEFIEGNKGFANIRDL